jgi:hypothetical protein
MFILKVELGARVACYKEINLLGRLSCEAENKSATEHVAA